MMNMLNIDSFCYMMFDR